MARRKKAVAADSQRPKVPPSGVLVRMYRQGLGDCFLLAFPGKNGSPVFMLIDCGVVLRTPNGAQAMKGVVEDIRAVTGGHIHVLVVTHEHWDHLSGFLQARDLFETIQIDEAWFPWVEDESDPLAKHLQERQRSSSRALTQAQELLSQTSASNEDQSDVGPTPPRIRRTTEALDLVKSWASTVRYHRPGSVPFLIPGADDARVYILGPPEIRTGPEATWAISRKSAAENPEDAFFAAVRAATRGIMPGGGSGQPANSALPFDESLCIGLEEAKEDPFFEMMYGPPGGSQADHPNSWRSIDPDWLEVARPLAVRFERDVNNQSLVMAIELVESGRVLLFPADAQGSIWPRWHDLSWSVRTADGADSRVTASDLLRRTVLYKVSHHGSHSGTAAEKGLELMTSPELVALVPVDESVARMLRWVMPYRPLMVRLEEKAQGRVIRSDLGVPRIPSGGTTTTARTASIRQTDLYIDVTISRAVQERDDLTRRLEEVFRGPILNNYDGYATARFADEAGAPLEQIAAGAQCRLMIGLAAAPPPKSPAERIVIEDGEDVPEVPFEVTANSDSLEISPPRVRLVAEPDGHSEAEFGVKVPADQKPGPCRAYVQVFQKTQLQCVIRVELKVVPSGARARP